MNYLHCFLLSRYIKLVWLSHLSVFKLISLNKCVVYTPLAMTTGLPCHLRDADHSRAKLTGLRVLTPSPKLLLMADQIQSVARQDFGFRTITECDVAFV